MAVIKLLPHPPDPLGGVKDQILKFRNNSVSCQYFLRKFHMQTEVQSIYNISNVIKDRRPLSHTLCGLRWWTQKVKIQPFQNTVMLHIKLKRIKNARMQQHDIKYLALRTPPPPDPGNGMIRSK